MGSGLSTGNNCSGLDLENPTMINEERTCFRGTKVEAVRLWMGGMSQEKMVPGGKDVTVEIEKSHHVFVGPTLSTLGNQIS